jgi:ATP/maltotriose-dependent transcriptional regulator MalT
MMGCALTTLAQVHLVRGELSSARQFIDRAVALQRPEFHGVAQLFMNANRGWVAVEQGDLLSARESLMVALQMARDALGGQGTPCYSARGSRAIRSRRRSTHPGVAVW